MTWLLCASSFQHHLKGESEIWPNLGLARQDRAILANSEPYRSAWILQNSLFDYWTYGNLLWWQESLDSFGTEQLVQDQFFMMIMCKIISFQDYKKCFQDTCFLQERNQHTNGQLDIVQREGVVVNPSVSTDSSTLEGNKFLVVSYSSTIVVQYPNLKLNYHGHHGKCSCLSEIPSLRKLCQHNHHWWWSYSAVVVVDVAAADAVGSGSVLKHAKTPQPSPLELLFCKHSITTG